MAEQPSVGSHRQSVLDFIFDASIFIPYLVGKIYRCELLSPVVHRVRQRGRLMANYIVRYFDAMYDHIAQIVELVPRGAPLAYVIGNSKFYGVELESDLMLSKIFEHFGIATEAIHKMRKRNSKSGLYEAVILMKKVG